MDWPEHVVGIKEVFVLVVRSWRGLRSACAMSATFNLNDPVSVATPAAAATAAASRTTRSTAWLASWWASGSFVVGVVVVVVVVAASAASSATTVGATRSTAWGASWWAVPGVVSSGGPDVDVDGILPP